MFFFDLQLKYKLNSSFDILLRSGHTNNSVRTDEIGEFLSPPNGDVQFNHENYQIFYVAPGLGYEIPMGNLSIGLGLFSGLAITNYPDYEAVLLFTTTNPPARWAHEGERPDQLRGILTGGLINLNYTKSKKVTWGIEFSFQNANFDYSFRTRVIPGGCCPSPEIHDTLKTYLLNLGLKMQYHFIQAKK